MVTGKLLQQEIVKKMKKNNPAMNSLDAKYPLAGAIFFAIELPIIKTWELVLFEYVQQAKSRRI